MEHQVAQRAKIKGAATSREGQGPERSYLQLTLPLGHPDLVNVPEVGSALCELEHALQLPFCPGGQLVEKLLQRKT